jgi:PASTA domain
LLVAAASAFSPAAEARAPGQVYDANNPHVLRDAFTANDKKALENFWTKVARDRTSYVWTAADAGGSKVPEAVSDELFRHWYTTAVRGAPNADALATETTAALERVGLWPRLYQGLGLAARSGGVTVATRAIPLVAGGFLLWEVGCSAGITLPLCHTAKVKLTPQQANDIRFWFTGDNSTAPKTMCLNSAISIGSAAGVCATHNMSRTPLSGTLTAASPKFPANVLGLDGTTDNGAHWSGVSNCWPTNTDYEQTYFSAASLVNPPAAPCSNTAALWQPPSSMTGLAELDGTMSSGAASAEEGCGQNTAGTPCFKTHYRTGTRAWYLDVGNGSFHDQPLQGTDPSWPSDGGGTATKVASDLPTPPARGTIDTAADNVLADSPGLRNEIVWVLNQQAPEPSFTAATPVDDANSPVQGAAPVPNCRGLTQAACVSAYQTAGFTGSVIPAVLAPADADLTLPADRIVSQSLVAGASVALATSLSIAVNPSAANMPVLVPAPQSHETYAHYIARLQDAGLLGQVNYLPDSSPDLAYGPDEVVRTNPRPGTRAVPGTQVSVITNPHSAPDAGTAPAPGGGGSGVNDTPDPNRPAPGPDGRCGPAVPGLNLGPLFSIPLGSAFPFGVFGWLAGTLGGWGGGGIAPKFTVPMPGSIHDLVIDLAVGEPVMGYVRPTILVISVLGLMWLLASSAAGLSRLGGGD